MLALLALLACRSEDVKTDPVDSAADTAPVVDDARYDAVAEAMLADMASTGAPGAAIAIVEGGELVWARGFGVTRPEGEVPVGADTLFRIGSVTKMMTAAGLLSQVDAGAIDLDAPLTDALPELEFARNPAWAPALTAEHLLTHQGGFYDYGELSSGPADEGLAAACLDTYPQDWWLMSPPGAFWNYANPNFSYAGLLHERAAGAWYREAVTEAIFRPLGMDRTLFLGEEVLADGDWAAGLGPHWATGRPGATIEADSYDTAFMRPAGFAWSSVVELATFARFLMQGDEAVLSEASRAALTSPRVDLEMGVPGQGYGYGLFVSEGYFLGGDYFEGLLWSHGGDINGYAADLYLLPEQGFAVAILASASGAHLGNAAAEALRLAAGDPATPPDLTVDPSTFAAFVGTYADPFNVGDMIVSLDGDDLVIDMPRLDTFGVPYEPTLTPYTPGTFILEVQGLTLPLSFVGEVDGRPAYARTRYFVGARGQALAAPPSDAAVSALLDRLAPGEVRPAAMVPPLPGGPGR